VCTSVQLGSRVFGLVNGVGDDWRRVNGDRKSIMSIFWFYELGRFPQGYKCYRRGVRRGYRVSRAGRLDNLRFSKGLLPLLFLNASKFERLLDGRLGRFDLSLRRTV
jgi:hypothetical protein